MSSPNIGNIVRTAMPYLALVGAVVAGTAIYNYAKQQGIISLPARSNYLYDPRSKRMAETADSFAAVRSPDSSQILTRRSDSNLQTQWMSYVGSSEGRPAFFPSNVDRHYNRIFYDRYP